MGCFEDIFGVGWFVDLICIGVMIDGEWLFVESLFLVFGVDIDDILVGIGIGVVEIEILW